MTEVAPSGAGRAFSLTQERFLSSGPAPGTLGLPPPSLLSSRPLYCCLCSIVITFRAEDPTVWHIPVGVITASDPKTPYFEVVKTVCVLIRHHRCLLIDDSSTYFISFLHLLCVLFHC